MNNGTKCFFPLTLSSSFPKSGTTWLQEIVYLIRHRELLTRSADGGDGDGDEVEGAKKPAEAMQEMETRERERERLRACCSYTDSLELLYTVYDVFS